MTDETMTRRQHINALVGDRLTADKADHVCERDGYQVTGIVLSMPDGRACIVNCSAVRWLHGKDDLFNLMHTDSALNQRLISEAVEVEREACAEACESISGFLLPGGIGRSISDLCIAAIRARVAK